MAKRKEYKVIQVNAIAALQKELTNLSMFGWVPILMNTVFAGSSPATARKVSDKDENVVTTVILEHVTEDSGYGS